MRKISFLGLALSLLALENFGAAQTAPHNLAWPTMVASNATPRGEISGITWKTEQAVWVANGVYGRMIRLTDAILCCYESGGKSWVKRSTDEGKTWGEAVLVAEIAGVGVANPELLGLKNGRIWLFFNGRPRDKIQKFTIGASYSDDGGRTWTQQQTPIFEAGTEAKVGVWEPAALQLPSGEIQLFFANEFPFPGNDDQEISLMRSFDDGATWTKARRVSFRAGHRDGMAVPLLLHDGKTVVFSIEDNGLTPGYALQPAIISTSLSRKWLGSVDGNSSRRWSALVPLPTPGVYLGAPYLVKLPSGETILSVQSKEGDRKESQMVVYIGDKEARNFSRRSVPVQLPPQTAGNWNALFVKNENTVTAITGTVINGRYGLWAIDGQIERQ